MMVVVAPALDAERFQRLVQAVPQVSFVNAEDEATALKAMPDAVGFLGKITPTLLAAAPQLRWVQSFTASLEHYLFPALIEHPCTLTNMRGLFSDVIADHVMGYVLCFARQLHTYIRQQAERRWAPVGGESARVSFAAGPGVQNQIDRAHAHLSDQTLGIVGLGAIGLEIARRALAFGLRVVAIDPRATQAPSDIAWLRTPDHLPELLATADYVVVAAPHTPQTVRLFRLPQFQQMKPTAYFMNIGRGAIVELDALVTALQTRTIAGAALDVFEAEPLPVEHPLWTLPNVIITPHVAGYSPRIAERHFAVLCENVQRFVQGESLLNVVDKSLWY